MKRHPDLDVRLLKNTAKDCYSRLKWVKRKRRQRPEVSNAMRENKLSVETEPSKKYKQ